MASRPCVPQIKTAEVPKELRDGEEFIKWDENSGVGTPVTLRIDENGFYLFWVDQNKEMEMLDISIIRDARTGKFAKVPKDVKLREKVERGMGGMPDSKLASTGGKGEGKDEKAESLIPWLEERTITICYGSDFVNLSFINFNTTKKEVAQTWTEEITKLVFSLALLNSSAMRFLMKAHTKLCLQLDKNDKIPIKNIVKMFAQNKEDRKRVEEALLSLYEPGMACGKADGISPLQFTFEKHFYHFYKNLTGRTDVQKVFETWCNKDTGKIGVPEFMTFLNETQRDPRLNEILHPYAKKDSVMALIEQYEPNPENVKNEHLSFDGFLRYLMSDDNPIIATSKLEISPQSMEHPLAHYFINSSHNTYITGHQITGKSSVEIYRQCLLSGCRCVELDFWNGPKDEPVIVHGYTFVPEISAKEVIEAIAEAAFITSEFPVVLSFENHCNPRQQAKIAQYCRDIFGDMLLDAPLDSHSLQGEALPPPSLLRRKIIIKNKKQKVESQATCEDDGVVAPECTEPPEGTVQGNGDISHPPLQGRQPSKESGEAEEENDENDGSSKGDEEVDGDAPEDSKAETDKDKASAKETEAGAEISALVNYVQPVHFESFIKAKEKNRFYEMSSFDEKQAMTLLKDYPKEFVNYNKRQLSRVYPAGTRFDSSNFMPQIFWNAGCQLVALNYQTLDLGMQLNLGLFEYNQRCGYLLKPEFMRRGDRELDPFVDRTVDGIIAGTVNIHVLSGQFLTDKRVGTYVEIDMYGLPFDTVRKKFRTRVVPNNGINPVYEKDKPFIFQTVVLPELASIRLAAYEESGKFLGHRVLPVVGLCPGFRHVILRNEAGQPLPLATLFIEIVVKDFVPNKHTMIAEALSNPIKYHSDREKREEQLAVLTEGMDVDDLGEGTTGDEGNKDSAENGDGGANAGSQDDPVWPSVPGMPERSSDTPGSTAGLIGLAGMAASSAAAGAAAGASAAASLTKRPSIVPLSQTSGLVASIDGASVVRSTSGELANLQEQINKSGSLPGTLLEEVKSELRVETLDKLMESKSIREKKLEMEKKLEALRKKHEKERSRLQMQRGSQDSEKSKSKFYMSNMLVKRLSSKNISSGPPDLAAQHDGEEVDAETTQAGRLLAVCREQLVQEKELQRKHQESLFSTLSKMMEASQAQQLKLLKVLQERETADVMRKLQVTRRKEVKELSKKHKDREELDRIKRELANAVVERGVNERVRLVELYEHKKKELEEQHEKVRNALLEEKKKMEEALTKDFEGRIARVREEVQPACSGDSHDAH